MNFITPFKNINNIVVSKNTLYYAFVIFLALVIGMIISVEIFSPFQILMLAAVVFLLFFVFNKPDIICYITIILMFTPLSLGAIFKLRIIWLAEPLIVALFFLIVLRTLTSKEKVSLFSRTRNPFLIPVLLYFLVLVFNFMRNPLPASSLADIAEEMGGIRFYYEKFLMVLLFFSIGYLIEFKNNFCKKLFWILLLMVTIIHIITILIFLSPQFYEFVISVRNNGIFTGGAMLSGSLNRGYDPFTGAMRTFALWGTSIGILILMSDTVKTKIFTKMILLLLFIVGLILSATRSFFFGTLAALVVWSFLTQNKRLLFIFTAIAITSYFLFNFGPLSRQFSRLFYFPKDLERLTTYRYELFKIYWNAFTKNLLFGVGVGATEIGGVSPASQEYFLLQNLRFGGHGFFLGTLYTQGIVGLLSFLLLYFKSIKVSFKLFKSAHDGFYRSVGLFAVMFIAYSFIPLMIGGIETYNQLFIVMGILAGVFARYQKQYGQ